MLDRIIIATAIAIRKYRKKLRLEILGSGKLQKYYKSITEALGVSDKVIFQGYLERREFIKKLISADFGIIGRPSINNLWITASVRTTLYEYMAAGLPVFAFGPQTSYTKYLINKYRLGLYVPSDNPVILANELRKFLDHLDSFDRKGIHEASYRYNWRILSKEFTSIVKQTIK